MGNRCELKAYFREDKFDKREKDYYTQFSNIKWTKETKNQLLKLANDVKDVWNSNFGYYPDDFPCCEYLKIDGMNYFSPDSSYTKGLYLHWDKHEEIPDYFLILFSVNEYKNKYETRGRIYNGNRFYTTVDKALSRLYKHDQNNKCIIKIKSALEKLPKESILQLDFSEILQSKFNPNYYSLEYYLERVKNLTKI